MITVKNYGDPLQPWDLVRGHVRPTASGPRSASKVAHISHAYHVYGPKNDQWFVGPMCGAKQGQLVDDTAVDGGTQFVSHECQRCARMLARNQRRDLLDNGIDGHTLRISQRRLGASAATNWQRMQYGTNAACSCGWKAFTNEHSPTRGGRAEMEAAFLAHLEEELRQ